MKDPLPHSLEEKLDRIHRNLERTWSSSGLGEGDFDAMARLYPKYFARTMEIFAFAPDELTDEILDEYEKLHLSMFRHYRIRKIAGQI